MKKADIKIGQKLVCTNPNDIDYNKIGIVTRITSDGLFITDNESDEHYCDQARYFELADNYIIPGSRIRIFGIDAVVLNATKNIIHYMSDDGIYDTSWRSNAILLSHPISSKEFEKGDSVSIIVPGNKTGHQIKGAVIRKNTAFTQVFLYDQLDTKDFVSYKSNNKVDRAFVKSLGLNPSQENYFYIDKDADIVISHVIKKAEKKPHKVKMTKSKEKIDIHSLKVGDRINVKRGKSFHDAIVVEENSIDSGKDSSNVIVYFEDDFRNGWAYDSGIATNSVELYKSLKKLKLNTTAQRCWALNTSIPLDGVVTKILSTAKDNKKTKAVKTKVVKAKAIKKLDLYSTVGVGDVVEITLDKKAYKATVIGKGKESDHNQITVYFEDKWPLLAWKDYGSYSDTIEEFGLQKQQAKCWKVSKAFNLEGVLTKIIIPAKDMVKIRQEKRASLELIEKEKAQMAELLKKLNLSEQKFNDANDLLEKTNKLINKLITETKEKEKEMKIDLKTLTPGSKIQVQVKDAGFNHDVDATVVSFDKTSEKVTIFYDKKISWPSIGNSWTANTEEQKKALNDLGLDAASANCWHLGPNDVNTRVVKVYDLDNSTEGKKVTKMANEKKSEELGFMDMIKEDMVDGAWRAGATQMANAVQAGIMMAFKDKGMDESKLAVVKEIFESEFGNALIRAAIGVGLSQVPGIKDDPRAKRLGKEFRVSGVDKVVTEVAGVAIQYLMPAFNSAMESLPPLSDAIPAVLKAKPKRVGTKHRVVDVKEAVKETVAETEHESEAHALKQASLPGK